MCTSLNTSLYKKHYFYIAIKNGIDGDILIIQRIHQDCLNVYSLSMHDVI